MGILPRRALSRSPFEIRISRFWDEGRPGLRPCRMDGTSPIDPFDRNAMGLFSKQTAFVHPRKSCGCYPGPMSDSRLCLAWTIFRLHRFQDDFWNRSTWLLGRLLRSIFPHCIGVRPGARKSSGKQNSWRPCMPRRHTPTDPDSSRASFEPLANLRSRSRPCLSRVSSLPQAMQEFSRIGSYDCERFA